MSNRGSCAATLRCSSVSFVTEVSLKSQTIDWRRLRSLRLTEVLAGAQTPVLTALAGIAVRRWGLRRVQARLVALTPWRPVALDPPEALHAARRLGRVVNGSARRGPWSANCLERSLTLWWLLRRRGLAGDLHIGVRRRPGGPPGTSALDFHAWVEYEGVVINDVPNVRERFATFSRPIAPRDARWR